MTDEWSNADPEGDREALPHEPEEGVDGPQEDYGDEITDAYDAAAEVEPDTVEALRAEWGAEFEANMVLAHDGARAIADEALIDLLEESGLGNDPRVIMAAARIGRLLQADGVSGDASADADERDALEETLERLSRRPDYWTDRVQRRVRQIHLALHGDR